jgi:hypothetical protein
MNRHQWHSMQWGPRVNSQWLTWSADQLRKQEQERKAAMRQMGLFIVCLVLVGLVVWGFA